MSDLKYQTLPELLDRKKKAEQGKARLFKWFIKELNTYNQRIVWIDHYIQEWYKVHPKDD